MERARGLSLPANFLDEIIDKLGACLLACPRLWDAVPLCCSCSSPLLWDDP